MTLKKNMIIAGLLVAAAPMLAAEAVNAKLGEWSITAKMVMEGMPFQMPAMTFKHCVTQENLVPPSSARGKQQECEPGEQTIKGNTITWSTVCKEKKGGTSTVNGTITYSGDSFVGKTEIVAAGAGAGAGKMGKITTEMSGKYLGPCPPKKDK